MLFLTQLALACASMELKFKMENRPSNRLLQNGLLSARDVDAVEADVNFTSSYNFYYTTLLLGSPAQELEVIIDTGSPISWVFGPDVNGTNATKFHPEDSTSWQPMPDTKLAASYGAGSYHGTWGNDTVALPDYDNKSISAFPIGVVDSFLSSAVVPGLLALGPRIGYAGPNTYKNLPEALHDAGAIDSPAFSISLRGETGSILFGGADLGQIEQPIYWYNYTATSTSYSNFYTVPLTSLTVGNNTAHAIRYPAVIDTGAPVSLVPTNVVEEIAAKWNLGNFTDYRAFYLNDGRTPEDLEGFVTFQIGSFSIDIPISDMFIDGEMIWGQNGPQGAKALAMVGSMNNLLGDLFCRHAYMTFDSSSHRVYLARRRSENTTLPYIVSPEGLEGLAIPGGIPLGGGDDTASFVTSATSGGMLYGPAQYLGLAANATGTTETSEKLPLETASGSAPPSGSVLVTAASGSKIIASSSQTGTKSSVDSTNGAVIALPGMLAMAVALML